MKFWILIFSVALFVGGTCLGVALQPKLAPAVKTETSKIDPAPPPTWSHHGREFSPTRFADDLKLTDEQNRELDAILSDTHEEMQALSRAMRSAQEKSRERIERSLSPEQKSKLDSLMADERQKRADADLDRTVASYKKILGLSEEKAKSFRAVLAEGRKQRRESYKPGSDYQQARKDVRERQNKKLQELLSDEQYTKYQQVSELERYER